MASAKTKRQLIRSVLGGAVEGLHGIPLAPAGAIVGAGSSVKRKEGETGKEHGKRIRRNMLIGALAPSVGIGALGAAGGAARHYASRMARKQQAYARRYASGTTGGAEGYARRQRWDPRTGTGFKPPKDTPSGRVDSVLSGVDKGKHSKMLGLARMAKQKGSPAEAANARRILDREAKKYGFSASKLMKHAAFIVGVKEGLRDA